VPNTYPSPEEILEERLADLNRRWNEFTYEERMKLILDIDREFRETSEARREDVDGRR
jgi:hypothetical protein